MHRSLVTILALVATAWATPSALVPDPNGAKNVGTGAGNQFITGGCLSTADCSQATVRSCCAAIAGGDGTIGICSGADVGNVAGKAGCGFGDGGSSSSSSADTVAAAAAVASPAIAAASDSSGCGSAPATSATASTSTTASTATCAVDNNLAGNQNVGKAAGTQFITGQCFSPADCASGCCVAQASGTALCKARLVTEEAGQSCDFSCTP